MGKDLQFVSDKKCPKCGKRKVYFYFEEENVHYICTACGHNWRG